MQTDKLAGPEGYLLDNLLHFGRVLRRLGFHISSDQIYGLAEGLAQVDITRRSDFFYTTRAYLVKEKDLYKTFERAFNLFWSGSYEMLFELVVSVKSPSSRILPLHHLVLGFELHRTCLCYIG